jgi:hypothetical protein
MYEYVAIILVIITLYDTCYNKGDIDYEEDEEEEEDD